MSEVIQENLELADQAIPAFLDRTQVQPGDNRDGAVCVNNVEFVQTEDEVGAEVLAQETIH